jgi:hypothetical protein
MHILECGGRDAALARCAAFFDEKVTPDSV